jgi:N-acetylmuramoyl-L-alanine amidase
VAALLIGRYELRDVVGHDDVAPFRKEDPGPAFPLTSFRSRVLGRAEDEPDLHETTTALNIRRGPGTEFATLPGSPLPPGTRVEILKADARWRFVEVPAAAGEAMDLQGWVHGGFLRRVEEPGG